MNYVGPMLRTLTPNPSPSGREITPSLPLWVLTSLPGPDGLGYCITALRASTHPLTQVVLTWLTSRTEFGVRRQKSRLVETSTAL